MSLNIIDLIKGQLGSALVSQAASQLGESESGISKAIGGLLPAVIGGLANNADKPAVTDAITNPASSGLLSNLLGGTSNNSIITTLLSTIFGDKVSGLLNAISGFSGISNASSGSLLNLVTGAALGSLGKYSADNQLGASGITSLLSDQKGVVSSLFPAGLSLASLGLGHFGEAAKAAVPDLEKVKVTSFDAPKVEVKRETPTNTSASSDKNEGGSIWKWLLPLLLLLLAGWFLWKQYNNNKTTTATTPTTTDTANVAKGMSSDTAKVETTISKTDTDIDLNGMKLKGYAGGMEDKMISFLKSGGYKNAADDAALKTTWYNFDHVNFIIGKSDQLEAGSQGQIDNLIAILKAFPEAKIKVGGYTDKTGDEAKNVTLSQARADYIKAALVKAGVGAQVLEAKGYGSSQATVPATATNAERAIDRKMAIRFTK